ncbi:MAG: KH domain-containing protein [Candidatus Cloacimonadota bacterium]|jgi:spoIIIJ-associated protein|nr:MAG: KH domain-containing protein [Candidatus Cloacimonadota bacterium]
MSSKEYCIETGKTVDEAVDKAIKNLACSRADVEVEIIDKGKKGFLGIFSSPVTVRVSLQGGLSKVKTIIQDILVLMDIDGQVFEAKEGKINILRIYTAGYDGLLIGRGGKTLNALQHVVSRMARKSGIRLPFYIRVGDYKQQQGKSHAR